MVETDVVEGLVEKVTCKEIVEALQKIKVLELEGCTGNKGFKGQHQKNESDGRQVSRRTIQKQDICM